MIKREDLRQMGFDDEFIDNWMNETYEDNILKVSQEKNFFDSKIIKFLSKNWIDYITTKIALKIFRKKEYNQYIKEVEETFKKIKSGEITDKNKIYEFYEKYGIEPIEIIDNGDGFYTYIYEDGFMIDIHVVLTGIVSKQYLENSSKIRKNIFENELNIIEENMSDSKLEKNNSLIYSINN